MLKDALWLMLPPSKPDDVYDWCAKKGEPLLHSFDRLEEAGAVRGGFGSLIYFFKEWDESPEMYGILAHEIAHVVWDIFEFRGIEEAKNHEVFAYLTNNLTERVIHALRKHV